MFGGSAFAHHAHDFALQAGDVLDFRAPVERKPVGGNSHRDGDQIATGQNCVDHRAADARKIDVPAIIDWFILAAPEITIFFTGTTYFCSSLASLTSQSSSIAALGCG